MHTQNPEIEIKDGTYYLPYTAPEYPVISENYLPSNVQLHFEFGPHGHADHFDATAERLKKADIYIPEAAGENTEQTLEYYRRFAKSNYANFKKLMAKRGRLNYLGYTNALLTALQGTNKAICLIDAAPHQMPAVPRQGISESPEDALRNTYKALWDVRHNIDTRDAIMLQNLGETVTKMVASHPKLRAKPEVSVLATLGSDHEAVYSQMAEHPSVSAAVWFADGIDLTQKLYREMCDKIANNTPVTQQQLMAYIIAGKLSLLTPNKSNKDLLELQDQRVQAAIDDIPNGSFEAILRLEKNKHTAADVSQIDSYLPTDSSLVAEYFEAAREEIKS